MRVLVIEDDEELAGTVAAGLRQTGMAVDVALDGQAGLMRALVNDYDVIVLDRDLPVLHGDEVCAKLVAAGGRGRMLMLTGAAENEDLVGGLGLGADDYLAAEYPAGAGAWRRRARFGQAPRAALWP
jgi:DNA-binding response OmpR family regulator